MTSDEVPAHIAQSLDALGVIVLVIRKPKLPVMPEGWKPAYSGEEPPF